jgi:hypothetical protein
VAPPTWSQPNNCGPPHRYELQNEDVVSFFFLRYIATNLLTKTVPMNIYNYIILSFTQLNPFLFIKNCYLSEGFSTLEKKFPDVFSEGNAAHPVGCDSPL